MWHTVSHHPEHTCTWTRIHATIFELCYGGCLHWASVPHCVSHVPVMLALWAAPSSVRQRLIACSWLAIRGPIRWSDGSPRCGELPSRWIANRQSTTVEEQWNHFNFSLMARSPIRSGTPREATRSGFRNKKTPLAVLVEWPQPATSDQNLKTTSRKGSVERRSKIIFETGVRCLLRAGAAADITASEARAENFNSYSFEMSIDRLESRCWRNHNNTVRGVQNSRGSCLDDFRSFPKRKDTLHHFSGS